MKNLVLSVFWLLVSFVVIAHPVQDNGHEMRIVPVNVLVKDLKDTLDLSSPLGAVTASAYLQINGNESELFEKIYTFRFCPLGKTYKDRKVRESEKSEILDRKVLEVVYFSDSVAGVIMTFSGFDDFEYLLCATVLEGDKWVNAGEQPVRTVEDGRDWLERRMGHKLQKFSEYYSRVSVMPSDTSSFVDFLRKNSKAPDVFILDALRSHEIVLYGEHHFSRDSWEFVRSLLDNPEFPQTTGSIILEMKQGGQGRMDAFFEKDTLDKGLLLEILGGDDLFGWNDKGMYEFLIALWNLNSTLPEDRKINVVLADYGQNWYDVTSREEARNLMRITYSKRDSCMAAMSEKTVRQSGNRSCLFIVGSNHAARFCNGVENMANLLSESLGKDNVFSIQLHSPVMDNDGSVYGKRRFGIFDFAFKSNDNRPAAFAIKNTPFGNEPYDACLEYDGVPVTGNYEDNVDAYFFLLPLEDEDAGYWLEDELYTDEYINEIKRRCLLSGIKYPYRGVPLDSLTKEFRLGQLEKYHGKKRYPMFL